MTLKVGDRCFHVVLDGARIEYWEYVLRTIRTRSGVKYGYWWNKLPGQTWGKVSKKHGDYGWLSDAWNGWRERYPIASGRPYAASKLGAIRDEIANVRDQIKEYGEGYEFDEDGAPLGQQLASLLRAQKRLRKQSK